LRNPECPNTRTLSTGDNPQLPRRPSHHTAPSKLGARPAPLGPSRRSGAALLHHINERLSALHPDYAALRRYLVDDEFLHRRDGFYWRAGGTFEVDPFGEDA
jgi:hypothetical protein